MLYWAGWRIVLPCVFGYELVPRKETLDDGTVLMTVRPSLNLYFQSLLFVLVLEQKTGMKNKLHP